MSEEQHRPDTFEEAFQHVEHDFFEAERGFLRRHAEAAQEEKAADERLLRDFHKATQDNFQRGTLCEHPGEGAGAGAVTHRAGPDGSVMNQSEGHLSCTDREGHVAQLETRLASSSANDAIKDAIKPPFLVPKDRAERCKPT
jgi:hypothetical protein